MLNIPLEDNYTDVLGKAMRGLKLDDAALAEKAGVGLPELQTLLSGEYSAAIAEKIAPILALNAAALTALAEKRYKPAAVHLVGLEQFNTPYEDMTVNSYLVWNPATKEAIAFDTGADATPMLEAAQARGLSIGHIFITHTHGDHIFDLDRLREKTGARVWSCENEPVARTFTFKPGSQWDIASLHIESRLTWGHSPGGVTYVITGLKHIVAVVGDSIFAGSMGGGKVSYADAIACNQREILRLPPSTVICPGHGPLTTVAVEKTSNPFFAK